MGKKSGPLAFLNKKTWHPANIKNVEEVWKREQKAEAEKRKVEELQKQLAEERKRDEFSQIAHDAGHARCGPLCLVWAAFSALAFAAGLQLKLLRCQRSSAGSTVARSTLVQTAMH